MTDAELRDYLVENGYPEYVAREGRAGLLRRWREFVEQVERGYHFNLEDYRNDLDVRAILALAGIEDEEQDARFEKMLTARQVRVWESAAGDPFWDFGYPKNAGPELMEDLRSEGLIGTDG
ncbi:MAG TPA: hypothetical protein VMB85_21665 [Bryobacteraceae bacterium]|nr:hypothetical protein [Bryobacteraceae bacterium]